MRTIALLGTLITAAALAASAWAQPAKEPAKPAPQEAPKAAAPKADAVAKAEPRKPRKINPRRQEDARHCLEKSTNTEIIKCAEAYL